MVPLYSLIVAEEELMIVAESSLRTGEVTGEKRRGKKKHGGEECVCVRDDGGLVEGRRLGQLSRLGRWWWRRKSHWPT